MSLRPPKIQAGLWESRLLGLFVALAVVLVGGGISRAQELYNQQFPLSTYLDLRPAVAGALPQTAPSWVESFDFIPASTVAVDDRPGHASVTETGIDKGKSIFRIRLLHPSITSDSLQMRLFFDDPATGPRPKVSVWNELGEKMMSKTIGLGLGLPSSEVLTVSMNGVNYLEIETPGDGSQMRGVYLGWMEKSEVLQPSDSTGQDSVRQPFGVLPAARTQRDDTYRFGAVVARLHGSKPLVLRPEDSPASTFEFEIEHPPLMAVLSYEALGAAVDAPPSLIVNGHPLGPSDLYLPDLADPAFQGEAREAEPQVNFRYTGWLRAQKMIPVEFLAAGLNNLTLRLSNPTDSVAIRSVSIQLKYNWEKLDTVLVPATTPVPYENH